MAKRLTQPGDLLKKAYRFLRPEEKGLERLLFNTWNAQASVMKFEEIETAILTGDVNSAWPSKWKQKYATFVNDDLAPAWKKAVKAGGNIVTKGVTASMKLRTPLVFNTETQAIIDWIANSGAQFLTSATTQQTLAVQNLLTQFTVHQPMSAGELGRIIRPVVGLNEPQSRQLANFRQSLLDVEPKIKQKVINKKVQRKISQLVKRRGEMIARTELSFAYHNGQQEAIKQAFLEGAFPDDQVVVKVWLCAPGCCALCQALDGNKVGVGESYEELTRGPRQQVMSPPRHPYCRCTEYYELVSPSELQAMFDNGIYFEIVASKHMEVYALTTMNMKRPVARY